ncbi:hypothetical protein BGZ98_007006 [Dissophora globulifera]|nr:hypothetical protein BGZ98_007006 [Dissophora globulifera]
MKFIAMIAALSAMILVSTVYADIHVQVVWSRFGSYDVKSISHNAAKVGASACISMQGISMQGISMQGISMQGILKSAIDMGSTVTVTASEYKLTLYNVTSDI